MGLNAVKMLGISITSSSKKSILEYIEKYLEKSSTVSPQSSEKRQNPLIIVTPNPEQVVLASKNSKFKEILNQADVAVPDGIGITLAARFLRPQTPNPDHQHGLKKISGIDLMEDLVQLAAKRHVPIGLIGGRGGVAVMALECLQAQNIGLKGWANEPPELASDGEHGDYVKQIVDKIVATHTKIVFVGLGAPKQEFFVKALRHKLKEGCVLMSVGGSFDEIAGKVKRPPGWIDSHGMKWFWRLIQEPWRWRRQLALLQFIKMVLRERFSK